MANDNKFDMSVAAARLVGRESGNELCCPSTKFPENASVTMAYIPYQLDRTSYSPSEALKTGSFFTSLNKPFYGGAHHE